MAIFLKIIKYATKLFFLLFSVFSILFLVFLYKPSYFLNNIENYLSNSFENYFSDIEVDIDNIEGNFFSGFNVKNINICYVSEGAMEFMLNQSQWD